MRSIFENIGMTREHHTLAQRAAEESFGSLRVPASFGAERLNFDPLAACDHSPGLRGLFNPRAPSARTSSRRLVRDHPIDRATGVNPRRISMDLDQRAVGKLQQTLLLGFEHRLVLLESPGNFFE